jgi:ubiquitin carboxyl-terminal hydrolase 12/46
MGNSSSSKVEKDFLTLGEEIPENLIGLENKSNTCYANSVIQSLYFCKEFRKEVLSSRPYSNTLLKYLQDLFQVLKTFKKKTGIISAKQFIQQVKSLNELFNNDLHHDSHEFLIWVLSTIDEELKKQGKSWVEKIFGGKFITQTVCLCCESNTNREELFMDLSLDVVQNTSLLFSLTSFTRPERLSGANKFDCAFCACKQEAERKTLIKDTPQVLICHLKRFKYSEEFRRYTKLNYRVAFPSELRIEHTLDGLDNKVYELFSIIVHVGPGFQYGHYMAFIKIENHWIRFDDEYIERVDESMIQYIFGSPRDIGSAPCGYILFYRLLN